MKFYKYSGSGNDFIFLNNTESEIQPTEKQIIDWCKRREGIGADGVILISASKQYDFKLQIFNADGGEAEMCGNASRCSMHFAKKILNIDKKHYQFETMNGVYSGELVGDSTAKVKMTELYDMGSIDVSDLGAKNALYLNTGVPHTVIQVSSTEEVKINSIAPVIRFDKRFPGGTNVDFFEVLNAEKQEVKLRVYERGVEDETLCCGTGVLATAVSCQQFFGWSGEVIVHTKGGTLKAIIDEALENLYFQGEVRLVYQGDLSE